MPKKRKITPKRPLSKQELSKWQKQKKLERITIFSGLAIIVFIVAVVGFGYYDSRYAPSRAEADRLRQTAIQVKDKVFDYQYLHDRLVNYGLNLTGGLTLSSNGLNNVIDAIGIQEIIIQEAARLTLLPSDEDVDKKIKETFYGTENPDETGDFRKDYLRSLENIGLTEQEYRDIVRSQVSRDKLLEEHILTGIPKEEIQAQFERILLVTQDEANTVIEKVKGGQSFASLVKELSQDGYTKEKDGNLGWLPAEEINEVLREKAFSLKKGKISEPIYDETTTVNSGYWLVKLTEKTGDKVKAFGMLLRTLGEAEAAKARIDAGEDFSALADELSKFVYHPDKGDLGEVSKGDLGPIFDEIVFNLEPGQVSQPFIQDYDFILQGGYWVIRGVEDPEVRPLSEDTLQRRKIREYNKWEEEKKAEYNPTNTINYETEEWIIKKGTLSISKIKAKLLKTGA
ncbi:MAG: peptidylprolyl isomerase [Dehalococcoidia bacterium]|nr:peptidylprolyl isomerase [Dehalococcoidia bacterium]